MARNSGACSAIVEMNHPGVWVMGDLSDDDRKHGMGIVVEYAGQKGKPLWVKPKPFRWDYTRFGKTNVSPVAPDETIEMTVRQTQRRAQRLQSVDHQR